MRLFKCSVTDSSKEIDEYVLYHLEAISDDEVPVQYMRSILISGHGYNMTSRVYIDLDFKQDMNPYRYNVFADVVRDLIKEKLRDDKLNFLLYDSV